MINFISKLISDSQVKPCRGTLKMPALILDKKEKLISRFISSNGLVEDPCAVEKERSMINPWTSEEKEIFMDKLTEYGKDFSKIASILIHKTTADCVEFYYKNHKSDCFKITKKHPDFAKQGNANNYLVASGKMRNCEANAASLDILGAASAIAANVDDGMGIQQKCKSKSLLGRSSDYKAPRGGKRLLERSSSFDVDNNERETVAADVLAGICGSLSSEAISSCITSAVDPGEGYHEWKCQRVGSSSRWPLTPEVTQNVDDGTCSDESCGEMDSTDWTDEEKSIFIRAVASYGKDFATISRYVSTRSRDQCKVFFSKARKCLGLDMICSGSGNMVKVDAGGGGSDTDDACVVETGSIVCGEKSGVKLDVDGLCPEMQLKVEPDLAGLANAKPDMNQLEENDGTGDLDSVDTGLLSKNLIDDSQMEDNRVDGDGDVQTGPCSVPVAVQDEGIITGHIRENELVVGDVCDHVNRSGTQADSRAVDNLAEHLEGELEGLSPVSVESSINDRKVKDDGNLNDASGIDQDVKSTTQVPIDDSNMAAVTDPSSGCGGESGDQQITELESDSVQKSCVIQSSHENGLPVPTNSAPQLSAVNCGKTLNERRLSQVGRIGGEQDRQATRTGEKVHSGSSLLANIDYSQILRGYPIPASTTREVNGESSCNRSVILHNDHPLAHDSYLRKCNGVKHHTSIVELNPGYQLGSPPDAEKPRRNGDVKLFGQILTNPSSQPKSSSTLQQNGDTQNQHSKTGKPFSTKFNGDQVIGANLSQTRLDHNNLLGSENIPARSFGFWDGSRIQTGFRSLPDSAMLLAKYPAAFGNYAMSSSKMEQVPPHGVSGGERSLNGAAVFPSREIGDSNAVADCQAYRRHELQPLTLDVKQRQDVVLSEMQRRNGFDVVSGKQQQARGMVGVNVVGRGEILVGGQCTGVSDPVAAIKMHYSKAEQLNGGQAGGIIREDDSWRGKGNIGR